MKRISIAVLISGRGSNLQSLIDACSDPEFPAAIALVICNRPGAYGLRRAEEAGIPTKVIDHKEFEDREPFEEALNEVLTESGVDLVCLAGFMRILTEDFVENWRNRLVNIHPSLLPAFRGLHTHERAIEAGVRFSGCTIHYVRPRMDDGPIILQAAVPIAPDDTPELLAARVLEQEHRIYPEAVRLIALGRTHVKKGHVEIDNAEVATPPVVSPKTA